MFFGKLDRRVVTANKKFGKLSFSFLGKGISWGIYYFDNNKTINNNEDPAEIFHKHFSKPVDNLGIYIKLRPTM